MRHEAPVTAVQQALHRRWRLRTPLYLLLLLVFLIGLVAAVFGLALLWQVSRNTTPHYADVAEHFKYGSIGSEPASGIPYRIWRALPRLFPEAFRNRDDYSAFGFLYENASDGRQRELPIGVSRRYYRGVEVVWLNCATCHTGTVHERTDARRIVLGMPSNNLDFYGFVRFLLDAGADERLTPDRLIPAMEAATGGLGFVEKLVYRWYVIPLLREGLVKRRTRMQWMLEEQPPWGPGRVDTFNPYKLLLADFPPKSLARGELFGASDFPAIFNQGPREGMQLHWDGNNDSLHERNISAALGAGVTPDTIDRDAINRVADWLRDFKPPASPYRPDPASAARGQRVYMGACAACHGYRGPQGYVFEGVYLGHVESNANPKLGVDPGRLDSYTQRLLDYQKAGFYGGRIKFEHFRKTDGYANQPLDGLWLRAPYLHNGSVPTLADLLEPPERRPVAFLRGGDFLDAERGGFAAPPCEPPSAPPGMLCYDTRRDGNHNGGHLYGVDLPANDKADLLAYLLTF